MYYKCQKISFNRVGSYIESPDYIKNKKGTINLIIKKHNKCFQYAVTFAVNNEEIKKDPLRITKNIPFINKYNWLEINFISEKDGWKSLRKIK